MKKFFLAFTVIMVTAASGAFAGSHAAHATKQTAKAKTCCDGGACCKQGASCCK